MELDPVYHAGNCWCGLDHARMDMDSDGNWYEVPEEEDED